MMGLESPQQHSQRQIAIWLLTVCALIFCMVVLGGATRLTRSGLSMVEWDPIMGIVPPMSQESWQETFDKYKQFPEYQKINKGMSLDEFKSIFWFEYAHRVLGRLIGFAFLLPFLFFLWQRKISRDMTPKFIIMFLLGGLQGLLGWYMVKSGLVDRPHVSQYRLTAHLTAAIAIYAFILWTALGLLFPNDRQGSNQPGLRKFSHLITVLVCIMIISGGFVAGTRAGFSFNTFPTMNGHWIPPGILDIQPAWLNMFENIITIQFTHRLLALVVTVSIVMFWFSSLSKTLHKSTRLRFNLFLLMLVIQVSLGIGTLLNGVPVVLGAAHQGGALLLLSLALMLNHALRKDPRAFAR